MDSCSYYIRKGLVYIIIVVFFSHQPFSCFKCTKLNTCFFYNVCLVSINKYIFLVFSCLLVLPHPLGGNTWWYTVLLALYWAF